MHKGSLLLTALLCGGMQVSAQTTPTPLEVRLICYDLLVYPATLRLLGGIEDQNRLSSQGRFASPNDEMAFAPSDVPTTHWGTFFYTDGQFFETFPLSFEVDIPGDDLNGNGIYDLLEFGQSVAQTATIGSYTDPEGGVGQFQATWSKNANTQTGTCRILFDFNNQAFVHTFEVLNYSGAWSSAVKEGANVHGPVTVTRLGTPTSKLSGELALSVGNQGAVQLTSTSLKDENQAIFDWTQAQAMDRDRTEFYALLAAVDGWLYEPTPDFLDWLIIVDDKNDGDSDGIPDLIDPPAVSATAPTMQIIKTENGIRLTITGDVGKAYTLEDAPSLPAAQWLHPMAVTLTASPHVIDLPAPTSPTFWRMRFP